MRTRVGRLAVPLILLLMMAAGAPGESGPAHPATPTIRWSVPPADSFVEVAGIDQDNLNALSKGDRTAPQWELLFSVRTTADTTLDRNETPAIVGKYQVVGQAIRFTPRFPFEPSLSYEARLAPAKLPRPLPEVASQGELRSTFTVPRPAPPPAAFVTRVDPAGDRLPENLLKFYVHFSAPMSRGEAYDHVRLVDTATGRALTGPFLEIGEELWDRSGRRLTLLLDPGRIKRGLRPREEEGPILENGKRYTLVIDSAWSDAHGYPLRETFRKSFQANAADERQPDLKQWTVKAPGSGTREPLVLSFPEPLDHAMLERVLTVQDAAGAPVGGDVTVNREGTAWTFQPQAPWRSAGYQVVVDTALEDLAGNSVARPFEVDIQRQIPVRPDVETVAIPFSTR